MHTATAYNYTHVSVRVHSTCTSYVLYAYLYCVYALVKEMTPWLLNGAFLAKTTVIKVFLHCGEPDGTYTFGIYMCMAPENYEQIHTHTHTHTHTCTRDNYSNPRCTCAPRVNIFCGNCPMTTPLLFIATV